MHECTSSLLKFQEELNNVSVIQIQKEMIEHNIFLGFVKQSGTDEMQTYKSMKVCLKNQP